MSTEDRSKLPPGLWQPCYECGRTSLAPYSDVLHESRFGGPDLAAAWAFYDRIRQEAAAAERERLAGLIEGMVGRFGGDWRHAHEEDVAAWLRDGGKGEP